MFKCKRWLGLVLCLVMAVSMMLPVSAVDPLSTSFASFLIHANTTDSPEVNLHIKLYRRGSSGLFLADDAVRYDCRVNRAAGDPVFYIQPKTDGVWVEVDYLTDLNGDGVYEMLDGEDRPVCDTMTATGELTPWTGTNATLKAGQTYLLTAKTLAQRGQEVLKARNTAGTGQTLPEAGVASPNAEGILYFVSLHYNSPTDKQEYVLSYYVRLYDSVIVPSDVPATAWYYGAVEYALEQGFFSARAATPFCPTAPSPGPAGPDPGGAWRFCPGGQVRPLCRRVLRRLVLSGGELVQSGGADERLGQQVPAQHPPHPGAAGPGAPAVCQAPGAGRDRGQIPVHLCRREQRVRVGPDGHGVGRVHRAAVWL